ncbi:MAG TPA: hypothetical protein VIO32_11645, partial [Candidatus Baltobacteraceae bacterium]
TQTDSQGTFALAAPDVRSVVIRCAYCVPLTLAVSSGEPVVALVHRYTAIAQQNPSQRDIASLPYARAESDASLAAFTLLENSSHALPGAQLSNRGLASRGSLLLDNGIPIYDIATNQSPFVAFPAYALRGASFLPPSEAFAYGDLAGGGTVIADTHGDSPWSGVLTAGNQRAFGAAQSLGDRAWMAAVSADGQDTRERADASFHIPTGDDALEVSALAAADRLAPSAQYLNSSLGGMRIAFSSTRENRVDASLTANAGGYDGDTPMVDYWARWSDVQAQGGVTTGSRIQFFADVSARTSSGSYRTSSATLALTAGTVAQTRVDAGVQTFGERYALRAGAGAYALHYEGGSDGRRAVLDGGIVTPSFLGSYAFDPHWTLELQAGTSFDLPTVLEAFVYPPDDPALTLDRNAMVTGTLSYGDLRRFRASLTASAERVSGLDTGTVHSAGVSAAWQIAPAFALRAWLLRDNDDTRPYEAVYRFGARPRPSTVGSYWLTYEAAGVRIDAIYRRDLLDYGADPHFDASLSLPLRSGVRIFAASERRAGVRYASAGLRFQTP